MVELEDEADVVGPPVGQLGLGEPGQLDALHQQGAFIRPVQAGDEIQQGGLAGAGRAHEGQEIAGLDVQGDVL